MLNELGQVRIGQREGRTREKQVGLEFGQCLGPGAGAQGREVGPESPLQVVCRQRSLGRRGPVIGETHAGGRGKKGGVIGHSKDVDALNGEAWNGKQKGA